MQKVSFEEIMREIYSSRAEAFAIIMAKKSWNVVSYDFGKFKDDMLRNELLSDPKTIRTKWDLLVVKGVVRPYGKKNYDAAEINLWKFANYMAPSARELLEATGREPSGSRISVEAY